MNWNWCGSKLPGTVSVLFCGATAQIGTRPPSFEVSRSHTHTHTLGNTHLNEWPARRRGCHISDIFRRKRVLYFYIHSDCEKCCSYKEEHMILHGTHAVKTRQWIDSQAINSPCSHLKVVNMFCNHKTSHNVFCDHARSYKQELFAHLKAINVFCDHVTIWKHVLWSQNNWKTCSVIM